MPARPTTREEQAGAPRPLSLALEAVTAVGAVAGVQGFLSGAFDPLVDQLGQAWSIIEGPVLPAVALGVLVGVPQAGTLALGLRRHPRAPEMAMAVGVGLTGWVAVQLPLIGWTSPIQWAFVGIGLGEIAAATAWSRRLRRGAGSVA